MGTRDTQTLIAAAGFVLTVALATTLSYCVSRLAAARAQGRGLGGGQERQRRNTGALWGLVALAAAYGSALRLLRTLTGIPMLDGSIGVALGLYICAHPAANGVNLLFFERDILGQSSGWSVLRWLALNLFVLLAGWMVLFAGIRRLIA